MDQSIPRRLRRNATAHGDPADRPSDLRQALADLGRVIGEPLRTDWAGLPGLDPEP